MVTSEKQITVFEHPPPRAYRNFGGNVKCEPTHARKAQAAKCANDQRHWSTWGEYILDTVTFEGQITVFGHHPGHTGIFAGI